LVGSEASTPGSIRGAGSTSSGPGTCGIGGWCSTPSSSAWNDAAQKKITLPCWIAVTRRTEKLPPSRVRSTWYTIGCSMLPARRK
jgi:hypothetical protein